MDNFAFNRIQRSQNLTAELADLLRKQIHQGKLPVGAKLPASRDIEEQVGVSRSVVREAVAQLKAEGILYSKQGVGVFVAEKQAANSFRINSTEFESVHEAIQILELRKAVEIEMCAMAASRRTEAQLAKIEASYNNISKKNEFGEDTLNDDFEFHKAIAEASGNRYFLRFIEFIGSGVIPAREIITGGQQVNGNEYVSLIQAEHQKILSAIQLKDQEYARAAIKAHLENSIQRHQRKIENL
ncbi:FadR/GntR family transcriptional regulator [Catenovulum sediminis]|uniref:FadR/GntR family transcriptional regulator n=1 Tax=Catenovulum sediminis TaxID=1740262 RepID=A0ABV1REC8_9ALTE|nr:FadR/GntR family transcriptional regulator [Catenovulum sediminis]